MIPHPLRFGFSNGFDFVVNRIGINNYAYAKLLTWHIWCIEGVAPSGIGIAAWMCILDLYMLSFMPILPANLTNCLLIFLASRMVSSYDADEMILYYNMSSDVIPN